MAAPAAVAAVELGCRGRGPGDWPEVFGLDAPTWDRPSCFHYASAEEAQAAIDRIYGPDARHVVVRMARVERNQRPAPPPRDQLLPDPAAKETR